ncbi:MAG: hypothetical protein LBU89_11695 [Fibromonadaceae bacterium]|jgi:hypothetical protein|nr:hypothetical protein [Fibromonadaceae bacterium]
MSGRIPKRVQISGRWHEVSEAWAGTLELKEYGGPVKYKTEKPYPVLHPNVYHVRDTNGNKVGEFDTGTYSSYSGSVTAIEL